MRDNVRSMIRAAFAADSLALGAHWVYRPEVIEKKYGLLETLQKPMARSYHPTKEKGDFTHYGDQMLWLLQHLASEKTFELSCFASDWQKRMQSYDGYMDHATKDTLANLAAGNDPAVAGSDMDDFSGAARMAPLGALYGDDLNQWVQTARAQTAMTHNYPLVIEAAEFLARTAYDVLGGNKPVAAMRAAIEGNSISEELGEMIQNGMDSFKQDTGQVIQDFGPACGIDGALPGMIHVIAKYEDNLKDALVANVMAGGDSAARGIGIGMVLGAHLGMSAIPRDWLEPLRARQAIEQCLAVLS